MKALILDTESNDLNGVPIEIAYLPFALKNGTVQVNLNETVSKYYSCDEQISFEAMSIHHILPEDIEGQPHYSKFRLPTECEYLIGHNIEYDVRSIQKCGVNASKIKQICTLNMARKLWPNVSHKLTALAYFLAEDKHKVRDLIKKAHSANVDVILTASVLKQIIIKTGVKDLNSLYLFSESASMPEFMPFGEHKGKALEELPESYVQHLLSKTDLATGLRRALLQVVAA